jgi:hypothetical protein
MQVMSNLHSFCPPILCSDLLTKNEVLVSGVCGRLKTVLSGWIQHPGSGPQEDKTETICESRDTNFWCRWA